MFTERGLINRIRACCAGKEEDASVLKGIGDDCAVFRLHKEKLGLMTTDTLVETVHFDLSWHPPELLGRKAASVNLSDIAAMGGAPRFCLLSVALPDTIKTAWIDLFFDGFLDALQEHNVILVGGDTVKSAQGVVLSVTVYGEVRDDRILYRAGAKPDDLVWVSGSLGEAAAGLALCRKHVPVLPGSLYQQAVKAHLDPKPQVELGMVLSASGLVHAMMDISDGLATDLAHMCTESGVGAEIIANDLPISKPVLDAADRLQQSPRDWALKGGEDYQLLFTSSQEDSEALRKIVHEKTGQDIFCVGRIVSGSGVTLLEEGERREIGYQGYDHFSGS